MRLLIGIALAVGLATSASAGCDDPVVDEVGAVANIQQVVDSVNRLGNAASADVRVRVFNGLHGSANLDQLKDALVASCPSWRNSAGTLRSSMILFFYAPGQKSDIGFYYGVSSQPKLTGAWQPIMRDKFVPAVTAHKAGENDRIGPALVSTLGDMSALFLQRPTGTTVIHQASDNSAFWAFMKWFLILVAAGIGAVYLGYWFTSSRENSRNARSAQADARRVRSEVVSGLLEVSDETEGAVLQVTVQNANDARATRMLSKFKSHVEAATSAFSSFDNITGSDPNADGLSVGTYRRNEGRYSDILSQHINPARELAKRIKSGKFEPEPDPYAQHAQRPQPRTGASTSRPRDEAKSDRVAYPKPRQRRESSYARSRSEDPPSSSSTFVFVETPVARESSWSSEPSHRSSRYDETPTPRSSYSNDEGGSFSSSSSSSDSGGSFSSSSSSSDSGGSFDSGSSSSSDSGGSSSSSD